MDNHDKIISKVDFLTDEMVSLTQKLIQIPSVNPPGNYKEISNFLIDYLSDIGLDVESIEAPTEMLSQLGLSSPRKNILATLITGKPGPTMILNGHIDVVPSGPDWKMDPFGGEIDDGKIYGRGAADMKGTLAAMIIAVNALKDFVPQLKGQVKLVFCVDEETGGFAGARYVVEETDLKGDYCISEGPIEAIKRAWNGAWWFNIIIHGKSAHGSSPWNGINAIEKMGAVIAGLKKLQDELKEKESSILGIRYGTINLGSINGGKEVNTICSKCTLSVSRRVIPEETIEQAQAEVEELLERIQKEDSEIKLDIENFFMTEPCETKETNPLIATVKNAVKLVTGKETELKGSTGFIDGRFFIKKGIPTIGFGTASQGSNMHSANEFVQIAHLVQVAKVYALTIYDFLVTG